MDPHQLLMQETPHQLKRKGRQMGLINNTEGQIIQVQGGRIIRSTGRKDRHSKVYTAKGPRDRRVRLSAHTAIQFYDVQDRLGFDRPSKAVDWLISKAKSAIDNLAELPSSSANYVPQQWDSIGFEGYPDRKSQDLCLSLQSNFQGQTETGTGSRSGSGQTQGLFMGSFEGAGSSGWLGQDEPGMGRLSRLFEWDGSSGSCYGTLTNMVQQGGMMVGQHDGTPSSSSSLSSMLCHGNQRGTLQSSAWNHHHHHHHQMSMGVDVSGSDGFMGFCIPANMNGDDHHHHEHVNKASTSSMSPNSSHERV